MTINPTRSLPWDEVEKQIVKESLWLENSLDFFSMKNDYDALQFNYSFCHHCITRNIATLIVTGKITAREIQKDSPLSSFWLNSPGHELTPVYHGKEWHSKMMSTIEKHFLCQECDVVREPTLPWGRADLGVYKTGEKDLMIEVGTTSALKLFINLKKLNNSIYLVVPNDERLIEFTIE